MTEQINFSLLAELSTKPHPLLNIAENFSEQLRSTPEAWLGEVFQEARNAHHLLDMAGVPLGKGYSSDLDARAYQFVTQHLAQRERLDRIASWHSRESGPTGTFGDLCNECGEKWPCDTRRMADGTYVDDPEDPAS